MTFIAETLIHLFIKLVQSLKNDRAIEIKQECDRIGVRETIPMIVSLLNLWIRTQNDGNALAVLKTIESKAVRISAKCILDLATLLVAKDRLDEAKNLVKYFDLYKKEEVINSQCMWHLLNAAKEYGIRHGEEQNISEEFLTILSDKDFFTHTNSLESLVIKEHIDKGQILEAITRFEKYASEFKGTPSSGTLLKVLIKISSEKNNSEFGISKQSASELLNNVINITKKMHGIEKTTSDIIIASADAGNEELIRTILMNPDVKFNAKYLLNGLTYFQDKRRIDIALVIGRSARGIKHDTLNELILNDFVLISFDKKDDYALAFEFYEEIKKQNDYSISEKFRKILANLLSRNNQKLPDELKKY